MAGADPVMVSGFANLRLHASADAIRRRFSRLTCLLRRLERLTIPTVAAINGLVLGGGLELAMACHHRVAAQGLALLHAVASEAAACLVAGSQDIDVLAVFGAGFPAWSGGPLSFLDLVRRGEIPPLAPPPIRAFYPDCAGRLAADSKHVYDMLTYGLRVSRRR